MNAHFFKLEFKERFRVNRILITFGVSVEFIPSMNGAIATVDDKDTVDEPTKEKNGFDKSYNNGIIQLFLWPLEEEVGGWQ